MTKNRAQKRASRARAALTGERYVVARRAIAEAEPRSLGRMHELMHKIPGMPAHVDGGLQIAVPRGHKSRNHLRHNEPRALVAWQNWIARRLGVGTR